MAHGTEVTVAYSMMTLANISVKLMMSSRINGILIADSQIS